MGLSIPQWVSSIRLFDIDWLESEAITGLFEEVSSYVQDIRIEMVSHLKNTCGIEEHPAILIGLRQNKTTIRFIDSLDERERVEAIAHELAHLLLIYRYGLRLVDHWFFYPSEAPHGLEGGSGPGRDWISFLGQMTNTVHHLILVPYLKEVHGIESGLHLQLLKNSCIPSTDLKDLESQYTAGLIAYEYERLIGNGNRWINLHFQSENFWKALESAQKYFQEYGYPSILSSNYYEENILSFLEDLGYSGEEFIFFPFRPPRQASG